MIREDIFAALFTILETTQVSGDFVTASRRLRHIEEVSGTEMPAVFQVQQDEQWNASRPLVPTIKTFTVDWWVYVYEPDIQAVPSTKLNYALDALSNLLNQDGGGLDYQTLDGQVFNAKINGAVEIFEGVLGDKAMAILPIRIVKAD